MGVVQVTGALAVVLPVGPRVSGQFQLTARPDELLVYDLTVTSSVDQANYQLSGEIFTGPAQYGVVLQVGSRRDRWSYGLSSKTSSNIRLVSALSCYRTAYGARTY